MAAYFTGISTKNLHFHTTPYTGDEELADGDDLIPDQSAIHHLVQNMLIAPPTPEPSPDAMALASIPAASLRVDVENGSGVDGAAKRVADALRRDGFTIGTVGNAAASGLAKTTIQEHSTVTFAGAKVRAALPPALRTASVVSESVSASSPPSSDVTVIVGRDLANAIVARTGTPAGNP